jgi:hypothetical protein
LKEKKKNFFMENIGMFFLLCSFVFEILFFLEGNHHSTNDDDQLALLRERERERREEKICFFIYKLK